MGIFTSKSLLITLFALLYGLPQYTRAQQGESDSWQDSLLHIGFKIYNEPNEAERLQANYAFIQTLVQLLKQPHSFDINLDTLNMISIKKSPDDFFRLFSWHLVLADGSYRYYGALQLKTDDGTLSLKPLVDQSHTVQDPEFALLDNEHWYGAQYYDIIPLEGLHQHYLLLGWKGSNPELTQKVIEVVQLNGTDISFGKAIFKGKGIDRKMSRMIYRYHAGASMLLKYEKPQHRIIMDHLAPQEPNLIGQFKYYGPDMSYDAWKIERTQLTLLEDLPLQNDY